MTERITDKRVTQMMAQLEQPDAMVRPLDEMVTFEELYQLAHGYFVFREMLSAWSWEGWFGKPAASFPTAMTACSDTPIAAWCCARCGYWTA